MSAGECVAFIEGNGGTFRQIIGMTVFVPLSVCVLTPTIRPLSLARLLFTYVLALLPLLITFDGVMALFRMYSLADLEALTEKLDGDVRRLGRASNHRGGNVMYLIGWPAPLAGG